MLSFYYSELKSESSDEDFHPEDQLSDDEEDDFDDEDSEEDESKKKGKGTKKVKEKRTRCKLCRIYFPVAVFPNHECKIPDIKRVRVEASSV